MVDNVFCRRFFLAASGGCGGGGRGTALHLSCCRRCCLFFLGGGIGVLFSSWVSGTLRVASSHLEAFIACVALMGRCVVWIGTGWLTSGLLFGLQQQAEFLIKREFISNYSQLPLNVSNPFLKIRRPARKLLTGSLCPIILNRKNYNSSQHQPKTPTNSLKRN